MEFNFVPMTRSSAEEIATWRYPPPYDFYDLDADPEDYAEFMDPSNWEDYVAVEDVNGSLIGFFTFEREGDAIEIGLGLKPELTGQGLGADFVDAGIEFARDKYDPVVIELEVALFNERAISVYEDIGFERVDTFSKETNGGEFDFLKMKKEIR